MRPEEVVASPIEQSVWKWVVDKNKHIIRQSDDRLTEHLLWVASKLKEMDVDQTTILAGMLHDNNSPEDLAEIEIIFGNNVAQIVSGMKEIKIKTKESGEGKWENEVFKQLLLAMVGDVRVFIIKLVEQLDNSRTMENMPLSDQITWAKMVLKLYGPMAETIGMNQIKRQIEDVAFKISQPEDYRIIKNKIESWEREEVRAMATVKAEIKGQIEKLSLEAEIQNRIKSVYSTYQKFKNRGWDKLKDRIGIRIITKTVGECYLILGMLHQKYKFIETELDDYIANPKKNGYQSIQTTLIWKEKLTLEVQIRTRAMHEFNEYGSAAHAIYKGARGEGLAPNWIREMSKWRGDGDNKYKLTVFDMHVYVLTPNNEVIQLPAGSTPLDFAYKIHTQLGNQAVLAKINGRAAKLNVGLKTGDLVEIVTSKKSRPNRKWLDWVVTTDAREAIKKVVLKES